MRNEKYSNGSFFRLACNNIEKIAEAVKAPTECWKPEELLVGLVIAVIALTVLVLCMIYITVAAGRNSKDEKLHLHWIDHVPTEILFFVFAGFVAGIIAFLKRLSNMEWDILNLLILTGTVAFLSDAVLLTLYLSLVRKIKADILVSSSISAFVHRKVKAYMNRQQMISKSMLYIVVCEILGVFFAWEAFSKKALWGFLGLLLIFGCLGMHFFKQARQQKKILEGIAKIGSGNLDYKFNLSEYTKDYRDLAERINDIGSGLSKAVEENVKSERLKTELITNVSHDIKTPLTSIINYVNLIKAERIQNERLENYVNILEKKSLRLKQLTEDLVEVSKINSGNITLEMQPINMVELIYQTGGEFNEIFEEKGLTIVTRLPKEPLMIMADSNRIWRVIQNLYNNVAKYALANTKVYVELKEVDKRAEFSIKDISERELNHASQDLSERFVRGDVSRGTEGNGLGLSIAKSLTNLMGGSFEIVLDGDLFTAKIGFWVCER